MDESKPEQKENSEKLSLFRKLIEIRKECTYLKKENQGYQFKYVSASQIFGAFRNKMDELNVLLSPRIISHTVREFTTQQNKTEFMTELDIEFTWINADDPKETLDCQFYAQGVDSAEKGVGKALTYAEKYFLLTFFQIATDTDDPDPNQSRNNNQQRNENQQRKEPPSKQKTDKKETLGKIIDANMATPEQRQEIYSLIKGYGLAKEAAKVFIERVLKREIEQSTEITKHEVKILMEVLKDKNLAIEYLPDGYEEQE